MKGIEWTEELMERLKTIYATGLSSSQIAAEMNCGISRNSVIGKVNRMGLTRDNEYKPRKPKPVYVRKKLAKPPTIFSPVEWRDDGEPLHVSLIDLGANDCRWPYGDGPFTHCGHRQIDGSSYCGHHFRLSVGRGTPSERAATKISEVHLGAAA